MSNESLLNEFKALLEPYRQPLSQAPLADKTRVAMVKALLPLCQKIPHPASGQTLLRWQILGYLSGIDLTVAKWLESHLDALSILHELGYHDTISQAPDKLWAVWAAEGHPTPVKFYRQDNGMDYCSDEAVSTSSESTLSKSTVPATTTGTCTGVKTWCSGATIVDFGLMTYRYDANQSQLVIIDMSKSGITVDNSPWQAVGMQSTDTATLSFDNTPAISVGDSNAYLERAGFWHGAAGVSACWYGATVAVANYLLMSYQQKSQPFKAMYLGEVSSRLSSLQQFFYATAKRIDKAPELNHALMIRQLRFETQAVASLVMAKVGEALGAAPYCHTAHFARLTVDLSVFIRQTHGAFDAKAIGEAVSQSDATLQTKENPWQL